MRIRQCACLQCRHEFTAEVKMSEHTQNISGEATKWCPACGSRGIMAGPIQEIQEQQETHAEN